MSIEWKIPLAELRKMVVQGATVKLIHATRVADVVREAVFLVPEEAIFVYRKISRALESETMSSTPWALEASSMTASDATLLENLGTRVLEGKGSLPSKHK